jgi:hypothetical protein
MAALVTRAPRAIFQRRVGTMLIWEAQMAEHPMEHVGPRDPSEKNSPIVDAPTAPAGEGPAAPSESVCYWNGNAYAIGAYICADHVRLTCTASGGWLNVGSC